MGVLEGSSVPKSPQSARGLAGLGVGFVPVLVAAKGKELRQSWNLGSGH